MRKELYLQRAWVGLRAGVGGFVGFFFAGGINCGFGVLLRIKPTKDGASVTCNKSSWVHEQRMTDCSALINGPEVLRGV